MFHRVYVLMKHWGPNIDPIKKRLNIHLPDGDTENGAASCGETAIFRIWFLFRNMLAVEFFSECSCFNTYLVGELHSLTKSLVGNWLRISIFSGDISSSCVHGLMCDNGRNNEFS